MSVTFEQQMLGSPSQLAVFKLHESEMQVIDHIKYHINLQVNADKEYAKTLSSMVQHSLKFTPTIRTPLYETWQELMKKMDDIASKIAAQAVLVQDTVIHKLEALKADRLAAKKLFEEEKRNFDSEYNKAKSLINQSYSEYNKAMVKAKSKHKEYKDLCTAQGKNGKVDEAKRKYCLVTDKLHRTHNDYVLSMREGNHVIDSITSHLLPMYMSGQHELCQDSLLQCKLILSEWIQHSDKTNQESSRIHADMNSKVSKLNPKTEYTEFVKAHQSKSTLDQIGFDRRLFEGYDGSLKPDEIVVDDSTYQILTQLADTYRDTLSSVKEQIESAEEMTATASKELTSLPFDTSKSETTPKRRHLKYLERKLKELTLTQDRMQALISEIERHLNLVDPGNLPKPLDIYDNLVHPHTALTSSTSDSTANGVSPSSSNPSVNGTETSRPKGGLMSRFNKLTEKFGRGVSNDSTGGGSNAGSDRSGRAQDSYCVVVAGSGKVQMTNNPSHPLEDESWFHGLLPREEVQQLLRQDGDYLVRESKKKTTGETQYVLSVMWQGPKHFIVQQVDGGWRFEGDTYPTIQELIIGQHNSNSVVTNKSQAILKNPVMRESWQIKNDDIQLEDKIGNGNFGDVFRGKYKGSVVAVKTCKDEVQEDQKKKFIQEGRILRQYDHPNIVKFVGIAAQKNPVMIVMEYVSGGALLSWLRKNGLAESRKSLVQMCLDAACGMEYLESKGVIHRDLAARNCLILADSKKVKISDFGMSREEQEYCAASGMRQIPIKWTAPEALNYGKYTSLCDVWSFGVLMWEIFSAGRTPYTNMKNQEARERVDQGYRMPSPESCPHQIYTLMRECWEERPERRPHFDRIVIELQTTFKEIP